MTKYSHIGMTKNSKNDERLRGNPKRGPKTPWRTRHGKQKLSDMTIVIFSGATGPT